MSLSNQVHSPIFFAILLVGATASAAHAGPLPPCIEATLSAKGSTLVVNELSYDDPNPNRARRITRANFRMLRRYVDLNEGLRMNGPDTHFANEAWSVISSNRDLGGMVGCPYTLVSDDAEYLILVGGAFDFRSVLTIYRRRDHPGQPFGGQGPDHGVLIGRIALSDLWDPAQIPTMVTDHTPLWFAGGTFAFSEDNRTLIHKTRWGKTFQIDLETARVTGM